MGASLHRSVRSIAAVLLLAVAALHAAAAPQSADATRAELTRWLESLRDAGTNVAAPLAWRYLFSATATMELEALSRELVAAHYAIEWLRPSAADGFELAVMRVELLTPTALERRNRDLAALARKHGARYDGVDAPARGAR